MVLRLVSNIYAIPRSLFDMVGAPVICASIYNLGFVSLDSASALDIIDEFIVGRFFFICISLDY